MANSDLVKKKTINLDLDTYERLSRFAAQLRLNSGTYVSMSAAVGVLLDRWERVQAEYEEGAILDPKNETE